MIRESLYFEFAGERSTKFNILNVSISSGLYTETFMSNRTINEITIRGREKPYHTDVTKSPLSFQLSFYFEEKWDDDLIDEVSKWLDVDYYQPLSFSENLDKVYYCMPVESTELIHNGLKEGYITLTMRCDSPYAYGRQSIEPWYECKESPITFEVMNLGHQTIYPFIEIRKTENGNIEISNLSRANNVMKINSLLKDEKLKINGENQIIETSLPNAARYNNFNDFYLPLYTGINRIQVTGACKIKLKFRYKFNS
ncbi:distal tail protein Dit [Niallia taxi]|uniref:distal tail protein Dit n=1 Tax=Niallia taxi TaxID=2499688 RepID=UPI0031774DD7